MSTFLRLDARIFPKVLVFSVISPPLRIKRRGEVPSSSQLVSPRHMPQLSPKVRQHLKPITDAVRVKLLRKKSGISPHADTVEADLAAS